MLLQHEGYGVLKNGKNYHYRFVHSLSDKKKYDSLED